jgi:Tfp pilus assembly protein PilO
MRVIAAITIFFLPATFTATFFSTTFFSFNSNLEGRVYSEWLWLYFLVSVVLTTLVVVGTWLLWKGKERELSAHAEKETPVQEQYLTVPMSQLPALVPTMDNYIRYELR